MRIEPWKLAGEISSNVLFRAKHEDYFLTFLRWQLVFLTTVFLTTIFLTTTTLNNLFIFLYKCSYSYSIFKFKKGKCQL